MDPGPRVPRRRPLAESSLQLHQRIRRRRQSLDLAGQELAELAGVSPAYISLIEKGAKIPSEEVAVAIAQALRDDPDLYRAWAQSGRMGDMESTWERLHHARRYYRDASLRRRLASGEDLPEEARPRETPAVGDFPFEISASFALGPASGDSRSEVLSSLAMGPAARRAPTSDLLRIPVLEEGDDPGPGPIEESAIVDVLRFDSCLLGGRLPKHAFAYRLGEDTIERVRDLYRPGDWVVLDTQPAELTADRVHAVRLMGRVILSRVLAKRDSLLLLPSEGRSDVRVLDLEPGESPDRYLVGHVVLTIRGDGPPSDART